MWYRIEVIDKGQLNKGDKLETIYDGPSADTVALSCAQILWSKEARMRNAQALLQTLKNMRMGDSLIVNGPVKSKLKLTVPHAKES